MRCSLTQVVVFARLINKMDIALNTQRGIDRRLGHDLRSRTGDQASENAGLLASR